MNTIPRRVSGRKFSTSLEFSQAAFARAVGVSSVRASHVIGGTPRHRRIALKVLRQSPEYWLNRPTAYDLAMANSSPGSESRLPRKAWAVARLRRERGVCLPTGGCRRGCRSMISSRARRQRTVVRGTAAGSFMRELRPVAAQRSGAGVVVVDAEVRVRRFPQNNHYVG
jgi:antitoxin HigA-1